MRKCFKRVLSLLIAAALFAPQASLLVSARASSSSTAVSLWKSGYAFAGGVDVCELDDSGRQLVVSGHIAASGITGVSVYILPIYGDEGTTDFGSMEPVAQSTDFASGFQFSIPLSQLPDIDSQYGEIFTSKVAVVAAREDHSRVLVDFAKYIANPQVFAQNQQPFPQRKSIKGVGVLIPSDLEELGVQYTSINVLLWNMLTITDKGQASIPYEYEGQTYYFIKDYIQTLDNTLTTAARNGISMYAILIMKTSANQNPDSPARYMTHPDAENVQDLVAVNLTDERGVQYYKAVISFLAQRYSREDERYGRFEGYIVGNEIGAATTWNNMGAKTLEEYVDHYSRWLRLTNTLVKARWSGARVYASFDHAWTVREMQNNYTSFCNRDLLDAITELSRLQGDFDWNITWHPYPENIFRADTWNDRNCDDHFDTVYITFKNLQVLPRYLQQESMLYEGRMRRIILSEQGFHSGNNSEENQKLQAAAYAYAYYKVTSLGCIDMMSMNGHVDNGQEMGLSLGLWTARPGTVNQAYEKKAIYDVFKKIDTVDTFEATAFALPLIAQSMGREITDWSQIIAEFDRDKVLAAANRPGTQDVPSAQPEAGAQTVHISRGTLSNWQATDDTVNLRLEDNGAGGDAAAVSLTGQLYATNIPKDYKGMTYTFETPADFSEASVLSFTAKAEGMNSAQADFVIRAYSGDSVAQSGTVTAAAGEWVTVAGDFSDWPGISSVDRVKIWVRAHDEEAWLNGALAVRSLDAVVTGRNPEQISFAYPSFCNSALNAKLNLSGRQENAGAGISDGTLRLTSRAGDAPVTGGAYFRQQLQLGEDRSFSTFFTFTITPGSMSADGLAFNLSQDSNAVTEQRGTMGVPTSDTSLSVEFDTYDNGHAADNYYNDDSDNHIGLDLKGFAGNAPQHYKLELNDAGIRLSDGQMKYAWIDYDGANQAFTVTVSNENSRAAGQTLSIENLDLSGILTTGRVYAGFTAEHYGSMQQHDIHSWYFDNRYLPLDTQANLYQNGVFGLSATGRTSDGGLGEIHIHAQRYDGAPAAGQTVFLSSPDGTFDDSAVVTDVSGNAYALMHGENLLGASVAIMAASGVFTGCTMESQSPASKISFAYPDFRDNSTASLLKLSGLSDSVPEPYAPYHIRAQREDGVIHLTQTKWNPSLGSVFFDRKIQLGRDKSFSTSFSFDISEGSAQEGLQFNLNCHSDTASPIAGVPWISDRGSNVVIEFDTKNDGASQGDRSANHLGYSYYSAQTGYHFEDSLDLSRVTLADGRRKYAWIVYDGVSDVLTVTVSDTQSRQDGETLVAADAGIREILPDSRVYAGFSALTRIDIVSPEPQVEHNLYSWYFDNRSKHIEMGDNRYEWDYGETALSAVIASTDAVNAKVTITDFFGEPAKGQKVLFSYEGGSSQTVAYTNASGVASAALSGMPQGSVAVLAVLETGETLRQSVLAFPSFTQQDLDGGKFRLSGISDSLPGTYAIHDVRAKLSGGAVQLSPKMWNPSLGSVFTGSKVSLSAGKGFSTFFSFTITGGADEGLQFILNDQRNISSPVYTPNWMSNGENNVVIELDTQNDGESRGDPDGNHLGYAYYSAQTGYQYPATRPLETVNLADGGRKYVWIDYDSARDLLSVTVSASMDRGQGETLEVQDTRIQELFAGNELYFGISAMSKDTGIQHNVDSWYLNPCFSPIATAVLAGDLNRDGAVNAEDIRLYKARLLEEDPWTKEEIPFGDLNNDGKCDILDIIQVKRMLAGYEADHPRIRH